MFLLILLFSVSSFGSEFASEVPVSSGYKLLKLSTSPGLNAKYLKWGLPLMGTSAVITYAIADRPMILDIGIGDCREVLGFDQLNAVLGWDEPAFKAEVEAGLKIWETVAGVRFEEVLDVAVADLVIGVSPRSSTITHARVGLKATDIGAENITSLQGAALCLDAEELWTTEGFHRIDESGDKHLSLRLVTAHEAGHVLGLDHPKERDQLMSPSIREDLFSLETGDIKGAQILYGLP